MNTSTRSRTQSAMDRLTAARPPVAGHTEGIVPRAERARLLSSIMEDEPVTEATPTDATTAAPTRSRVAPVPPARPQWTAPPLTAPSPHRRVLIGALVASVVAAGLGVGALVGDGDHAAQVNAGPGELGSGFGPPAGAAARFLPGPLPDGMVLQNVAVEPGVAPLPGTPYAEVYGRVGPKGSIEQAVAVLTATEPDVLDALLEESGAITAPVPGRPGELDIDFGQGLVARSFDSGTWPRQICGSGGCVILEDQEPSSEDQEPSLEVMVLARDLDGGLDALPGVINELAFSSAPSAPTDRVEAPALVADGFTLIYGGDQVPGLAPGTATTSLGYGDASGQRNVTLWLYEGRDFDPAGLAWQYPESRPVTVRGRDGLLVANGLGSSVTWQERPGLTLSVDVFGLAENEAVEIANGVREVAEDEWRAVAPSQGATGTGANVAALGGDSDGSVVHGDSEPMGPTVVLSEGQAGTQRWELVGYPVDPTTESGTDSCTELRVEGEAVSVMCSVGVVEESVFTAGNHIISLGPERELDGQVLFRGRVHPDVVVVRFQLDTGETLDVPTVGRVERLGTHVVAAMPVDAQGATVILVDEAGAELQRMAFPSFRPVGG